MAANPPYVTVPPKTEFVKIFELTKNTPETARYTVDEVTDIVGQSRILKASPENIQLGRDVIAAMEEFADFVELKQSTANKWGGEIPAPSDFANLQLGLGQRTFDKLQGQGLSGVRLDFAISADGHFLRGFAPTVKDDPLFNSEHKVDTVKSLDTLFSSWLAEQNPKLLTEGGRIYRVDENGNKERPLTVDELDKLMANSAEDFKAYLKAHGNIDLKARQREYEGENRLEQAKAARANEKLNALADRDTEGSARKRLKALAERDRDATKAEQAKVEPQSGVTSESDDKVGPSSGR
ncbi:MAG: hypothetical protein ACRCXC_01595 [Legionella sp.]